MFSFIDFRSSGLDARFLCRLIKKDSSAGDSVDAFEFR